MRDDDQPRYPTGSVRTRRGFPYCGECGRRVAHPDQERCPWLSCRVWFIGRASKPTKKPTDRQRRARTPN